MKKFSNKYWFVFALIPILGIFAAGWLSAFPSSNDVTDFWTIKGIGTLRTQSIAYIDSNRDLNLYDGDINLGSSQSRPTTTAGTYPGLLVPIYNGSGASLTEGMVVVSSANNNVTAGYGTTTTAVATTTVLGIAAETIADGAVGLIRVGGWAIVKTTGSVFPGDVLVSTNVAGYAGTTTGTQVVGTAIGKAVSKGTAAGGNTLVLLNQ